MTEPAATLRDRIADAIHRYDRDHLLSRNGIPSKHHYGEADAVLAVLPPPTDRAAVPALTQTQRDMLRYALDLAEEQMLCVGDEFSEDDYAAVDSLRRLAAEPPAAEEAELACTCGRTACESDLCDCDVTPCPVDHAAAGARL